MEDTCSTLSSHSQGSVSLSKMECPYCNKDLQVRAMFNHIRKLHNEELLKNTSKKWLEEADTGKALKFWWSKKNDFDEDEEIVIYVCLSTNKTFTTQERADLHFKKDKALLKDHNKNLKELKKQFATYKKQQAKRATPTKTKWQLGLESNDPELARSLWKSILHHKKVNECAMMICNKRGYSNDVEVFLFDKERYNLVKWNEFVTEYNRLMSKVEYLQAQKCLEVKTLWNLWTNLWTFWTNSFRESMFEFSSSLAEVFPNYNHFYGTDDYGFGSEDMEGVTF